MAPPLVGIPQNGFQVVPEPEQLVTRIKREYPVQEIEVTNLHSREVDPKTDLSRNRTIFLMASKLDMSGPPLGVLPIGRQQPKDPDTHALNPLTTIESPAEIKIIIEILKLKLALTALGSWPSNISAKILTLKSPNSKYLFLISRSLTEIILFLTLFQRVLFKLFNRSLIENSLCML